MILIIFFTRNSRPILLLLLFLPQQERMRVICDTGPTTALRVRAPGKGCRNFGIASSRKPGQSRNESVFGGRARSNRCGKPWWQTLVGGPRQIVGAGSPNPFQAFLVASVWVGARSMSLHLATRRSSGSSQCESLGARMAVDRPAAASSI